MSANKDSRIAGSLIFSYQSLRLVWSTSSKERSQRAFIRLHSSRRRFFSLATGCSLGERFCCVRRGGAFSRSDKSSAFGLTLSRRPAEATIGDVRRFVVEVDRSDSCQEVFALVDVSGLELLVGVMSGDSTWELVDSRGSVDSRESSSAIGAWGAWVWLVLRVQCRMSDLASIIMLSKVGIRINVKIVESRRPPRITLPSPR